MRTLDLYSEPYGATGGLAAEGILNQLGRPNMEALEVLVREAVQNCWDAKSDESSLVTVKIGRKELTGSLLQHFETLFAEIPPGLPLADHLIEGEHMLYFADFGTDGLAGPTRADRAGQPRDFIDFVLNIGQPPDKDLAGGSFGYGKAAFYLASKAQTVVVDTMCSVGEDQVERRLIACGLGTNFEMSDSRPFTGRHWWGRTTGDGHPTPLTGQEAASVAALLGLPERNGYRDRGTTVAILASNVAPASSDGHDQTMQFLGQCLVWNFWPRMIDTPGANRGTLKFELTDEGRRVPVPDPRQHSRLRGFVEAMDQMRVEPDGETDFIVDRTIELRKPRKELGRLVLAKGPIGSPEPTNAARTLGANTTADGIHHVALMRTPEIVVRYFAGEAPTNGRFGYSGVFRCTPLTDDAFKAAEPPAHDDWVPTAVTDPTGRSVVNVALKRIREVCREIAGYGTSTVNSLGANDVPLGEFADAMAVLMPGIDGTGARRPATNSTSVPRRRRRHAPGRTSQPEPVDDWIDAEDDGMEPEGSIPTLDLPDGSGKSSPGGALDSLTDPEAIVLDPAPDPPTRPRRRPQVRSAGDPRPFLTSNGTAVMRYPFEIRSNGNRIRVSARIEIMTNDGGQVESEPPVGEATPQIHAWTDPAGQHHIGSTVEIGPIGVDGSWMVEVGLITEAMMRVDIDLVAL